MEDDVNFNDYIQPRIKKYLKEIIKIILIGIYYLMGTLIHIMVYW